jgi:hypothetical protein
MVEPKQSFFVPDETAMQKSFLLVTEVPDPSQEQVELLLSQCFEGTLNEDYVCSICKFVAWDVK